MGAYENRLDNLYKEVRTCIDNSLKGYREASPKHVKLSCYIKQGGNDYNNTNRIYIEITKAFAIDLFQIVRPFIYYNHLRLLTIITNGENYEVKELFDPYTGSSCMYIDDLVQLADKLRGDYYYSGVLRTLKTDIYKLFDNKLKQHRNRISISGFRVTYDQGTLYNKKCVVYGIERVGYKDNYFLNDGGFKYIGGAENPGFFDDKRNILNKDKNKLVTESLCKLADYIERTC